MCLDVQAIKPILVFSQGVRQYKIWLWPRLPSWKCLYMAFSWSSSIMVFFGIPSFEKYQRQETIVLSSRKITSSKGIEAPAVTFVVLSNTTGYGWKTKTNQTGSINGRYTDAFLLDHCKKINQLEHLHFGIFIWIV